MLTKFKGREVEYDIQFQYHDCDSYISEAAYLDPVEYLTEEELEQLQEQEQSTIDTECIERKGFWRD